MPENNTKSEPEKEQQKPAEQTTPEPAIVPTEQPLRRSDTDERDLKK